MARSKKCSRNKPDRSGLEHARQPSLKVRNVITYDVAVPVASEGQTVWVLVSDGKLKPVTVKVGLSDGVYTEIVAGDLHAGDQVAVRNSPGAKAATPPPMPGRGPRI